MSLVEGEFTEFVTEFDEASSLSSDEAHAKAEALGCQCSICPLRGQKQGPVFGEFKPSKLLVIAQEPGIHEVNFGKPMIGPSGGLLSQAVNRDDISITNALLCKPPEELDWYTRHLKGAVNPLDCCRPRLAREMQPFSTILVLGKFALEAVAKIYSIPIGRGKEKPGEKRLAAITSQAGHPYTLPDGKILCSSLHPAHALRKERHKKHVIVDQIQRALRIAEHGVEWREPELILNPTSEVVIETLTQFLTAGTEIVVDIETDSLDVGTKIRCVGIKQGPITIVVPRFYMDGRPVFADLKPIDELIRRCTDELPLAFHNGLFDTHRLLRSGLMSDWKKTWFDSMFAHRNSRECDSEHDLGFVAGRAIDIPLWKVDVDHKVSGNVNRDFDLWRYNGLDLVGTQYAVDMTRRWVEVDGTSQQLEIDTQLAICLRGMSDLGLWIDEATRHEMSTFALGQCTKFIEELRRLTRRADLNPRSPHHLRQWFFGTKGYRPIVNTENEAFEDDDDPSTSANALLALEDAGVDKETSQVIDLLLRYKSIEKLRSGFIDNMPSKPIAEGFSILRPSYSIVVSGRFNSQPNCQNIPKGGVLNLRKMFSSPPDHVWVGMDYEQIEARLYAVAAQDKLMLDAFAKGMDVHSWNAASIFYPDDLEHGYAVINAGRKSPNLAEKKDAEFKRNCAKTIQYLESYGGEGEKLGQALRAYRNKVTNARPFKDLPEKLSQAFHDTWHKLHPTKAWHERVNRELRYIGHVVEPIHGRKRFFPGGPSKKNAPPNHTIQAKAAAIANRAMLRIVEKIPFRGWSLHSGVSIQIHDYIGVVVPATRAEEAKEILEQEMYYEEPDGMGRVMKYSGEAVISKTLGEQ